MRRPGMYIAPILLALVILAQGTLLARVHFFGAHPDLLLVVVVCWSLIHGVTEGLLLAFFGGLGLDIIAGAPLGGTALALMPTTFFGTVSRNSVFMNHALLPVALVLLATPLHGLIVLLLQQVRGAPVDWAGSALRVVLPALALNGLLTLLVFPLLRWLAGRSEAVRAG